MQSCCGAEGLQVVRQFRLHVRREKQKKNIIENDLDDEPLCRKEVSFQSCIVQYLAIYLRYVR